MKRKRNEVPEAMARAAAHLWAERVDGTAYHDNRGRDLASAKVVIGVPTDLSDGTLPVYRR